MPERLSVSEIDQGKEITQEMVESVNIDMYKQRNTSWAKQKWFKNCNFPGYLNIV